MSWSSTSFWKDNESEHFREYWLFLALRHNNFLMIVYSLTSISQWKMLPASYPAIKLQIITIPIRIVLKIGVKQLSFPLGFMTRALLAWATNSSGKSSVHFGQDGRWTRLVRGISSKHIYLYLEKIQLVPMFERAPSKSYPSPSLPSTWYIFRYRIFYLRTQSVDSVSIDFLSFCETHLLPMHR